MTGRACILVALVAGAGCREKKTEAPPPPPPPVVAPAASAAVRDASVAISHAPKRGLPDETLGDADPGPWPSLDAYCKKIESVAGRSCKRSPLPIGGADAGGADAERLDLTDDDRLTAWVALKTSRGWFPQVYQIDNHRLMTGFMIPEVVLEKARVSSTSLAGPVLTLVYFRREWSPVYGEDKPKLMGSTSRWVVPISFPDDYPVQNEAARLSEWTGDIGFDFDGGKLPEGRVKTFRVEDDGGISVR